MCLRRPHDDACKQGLCLGVMERLGSKSNTLTWPRCHNTLKTPSPSLSAARKEKHHAQLFVLLPHDMTSSKHPSSPSVLCMILPGIGLSSTLKLAFLSPESAHHTCMQSSSAVSETACFADAVPYPPPGAASVGTCEK